MDTVATDTADGGADSIDAPGDASDVSSDRADIGPDTPIDTPLDAPADAPIDVPLDGSANPCVAAGGTCMPAMRSSGGVPGFSVMCPSMRVLSDGMASHLGPGTDYLGTALNGGCGSTSVDGGEATLYACCYARPPVDAGADAIADAPTDALTDAPADAGAAASCLASGGTLGMSLCCLSSGDFPSSCLTGACGCSPSASHMVRTCNCPTGMCFDGTRCRTP